MTVPAVPEPAVPEPESPVRPHRVPSRGSAGRADRVLDAGQRDHPDGSRDPSLGAELGAERVPVLVLVSADWAAPSRPAPTLLRELSRRWGTSMQCLLVEDPADAVLDRWEIQHLPTWLRFVADDEDGEEIALHGLTPGGEELALDGPWRLTHRRSGALPKHVVDAQLGPEAG